MSLDADTGGASAIGEETGFSPSPESLRFAALADALTPWAIRAAAALRVADHIAAGADTLDELAARTGADADALRRLLRHLVCKGVFAAPAPDRYALTGLAEYLREDHPYGMRAWLDADSAASRWDMSLAGLADVVRTGEPGYDRLFGRSFWRDVDGDAELSASFDALMAHEAGWTAREILDGYDWHRSRHVVDVGGGTGGLLFTLLHAHPDMRGTLLDRPRTVTVARRALAESGLGDRCRVLAGSIFAPLPPHGDTYVLANVLHDWDDDAAAALLRRAAAAAGDDGRVVVIEMLLDTAADPGWMAETDLRMLCAIGGRKRTTADVRRVAADAGLSVPSVHRTPSGVAIVTCTR